MRAARTLLALPAAPVRQALTTPQPILCLGGCGRWLRSPKSIAAGYGPTCAAKVRLARLSELRAVPAPKGFKAEQVAKARELVEEGALVQVRPRVWRTVSGDGRRTYLTAREACNCPAGLRSTTPCYHRAAVEIVERAAGGAVYGDVLAAEAIVLAA